MKNRINIGQASGAVRALGKRIGLSQADLAKVARIAPNLQSLAQFDLAQIRDVPAHLLKRLRDAGQLATLPCISINTALSMLEAGITRAELARDRDRAAGIAEHYGLSTSAMVAAARAEKVSVEQTPIAPFRDGPPTPPAFRRWVADREMSWNEIAGHVYDPGPKVEHLGKRLATANGARLDEPVLPGTRVVLPELPGLRYRESKTTEALRRFAAYIDEPSAEALVNAGFFEPQSLLYLDPASDTKVTHLSRTLLDKVRLQAVAVSAGIPSTVAHAMAIAGPWPTVVDLALANPEVVRDRTLELAALGFGGIEESDLPTRKVRSWLLGVAQLVDKYGGLVGIEVCPSPVQACSTELPADASIENFYNYRTIPATADEVGIKISLDQRRLKLEEVALRRASSGSAADAEAYRDQVLDELGVTEQQRALWTNEWGFDPTSDVTADQKLTNLERFLTESIELTELLQALAGGHEAYQRGELGMALSSYTRVSGWFDRMLHTDLARSIDPTVAGGLPPRVKAWYENVRPALDSRSFLDHLQNVFDIYHAQMLRPWDPDKMHKVPEAEPFRKHLFYLRSFVLPLCVHDCYLELGSYCEAYSQILKIRHQAAYTDALDNASEDVIGLGAGHFPAVQSGLDPSGWGAFPETYLHPVERRLLDIKIGRLMKSWGEYHERRGDPRNVADADIVASKARYAQVLRVHFAPWSAVKGISFSSIDQFRQTLRAALGAPINPLSIEQSFRAHEGLARILHKLNFIGYDTNYVPLWTYEFLLASARYFADHARSLERDALTFLTSAESELGNQRLLSQQIGTATSQVAVEGRRLDDANAGVVVAQAGVDLANLRQLNNLERQREWDTVGPTLLAIGVVGGATGGAGSGSSLSGGNPYAMAGGAVLGGLSSYLSGNIEQEMHRNELDRQQHELDQAAVLSQAEKNRALIAVDIGKLVLFQAASSLAYAQSNLEFATAKTLSADFWFATERRIREFAQSYLDSSIRLAFLAEQAFEFVVGRRINRIRFDYASSDNRLAADALLLDIDSIETERILSRASKDRPIRHVIPLRTRDFWAFERLKRNGFLTFETLVSEFDFAYPGTYMQRLVDVEVVVRALVPPSGIRGTLAKSGLSWLRFRNTDGLADGALNAADDWITETPTEYKIAPAIVPDETMILSTYDIRRDGVVLRVQDQNELLRLFEGTGLGCTWRLSFDPSTHEIDLRTFTDVDLVLYFTAQYDADLADEVQLERRKQLALGTYKSEKTKGYAFRDTVPDAFYHLLNSGGHPDTRLARTVMFDTLLRDLPPGEVNRHVNYVVIAFLGENGPIPMAFRISSAVHSPAYEAGLNNVGALVMESSAAATTDPAAPNVYAFGNFGQNPVDRWFLRVVADDNPAVAITDGGGALQRFRVDGAGHLVLDGSGKPIPDALGRLIFDDKKVAATLTDVWWILRYKYELDGRAGHPVPLWAHFSRSRRARFAQAGVVAEADWNVEDVAGAWNYGNGAWRHSDPTGGFLRDPSPDTWGDVELFALAQVVSAANTEVGLIARWRTPLSGTGYRLRLVTRAVAPVGVDAVLERIVNGAATEIGRQDNIPLALDTIQSISFSCRAGNVQAQVGEVTLVAANDPHPLPAGDVGFWGRGTGPAFMEFYASDLSGRP